MIDERLALLRLGLAKSREIEEAQRSAVAAWRQAESADRRSHRGRGRIVRSAA